MNEKKASTEISIEEIKRDPGQPRTIFDPDRLKQLADSIQREGLHHPILLHKEKEGYIIIAGERRFRAHELLGKETIRAEVVEGLTPQQRYVIAFQENDSRDNLNMLETAKAFEKMRDKYGMSVADISKSAGRSTSTILNTLSVLSQPKEIQDLVVEGKLKIFDILYLKQVEDEEERLIIAQQVAGGLMTRVELKKKVEGIRRREDTLQMLPRLDDFKKAAEKKRLEEKEHLMEYIPKDMQIFFVLGAEQDLDLGLMPATYLLISAYSILRKKGGAKPLIDMIVSKRDQIDTLFIDSGLLSGITNGDTEWVNHQKDVAQLANAVDADLVTHMDCPLYQRLVDRCGWTKEEMYQRTIKNAAEFLDIKVKGTKVFGLQGYKNPEHYVECLHEYDKLGILDGKNWLGCGGTLMRSKETCWATAKGLDDYIQKSKAPNTHVHFFGIAKPDNVAKLYDFHVRSVDNVAPLMATWNNLWFRPSDGKMVRGIFEGRRPPELAKAQLYFNFTSYLLAVSNAFKRKQEQEVHDA